MSEVKKNVPELRFKGFSDPWEQRKLGELLTEVKRPIKMKDDESYELVTVKRRNEGIVSRGIFKGKDVLVNSQFQIKTGDYLISKRQVVHGANGIVPNHLNNAIVSNEYLVSIGNKNITTDFLSIISRLPSMYRKFFLSSYGIDIEKLVFNVEDWKKRTIQVPSISEQNQITIFFKQLDSTIALHQRKLNLLKQLKQTYLQKMFPQNEDIIPEIRFAGYLGSWLQHNLGDLAKFEKGKGYSKNDLVEYGFRAILYGRLYKRYQTVIETIDTYVESDDGSIRSKAGDIIVPASGESSEDISRASVVPYSGIILGGDLNIIEVDKKKLYPIFVALSISHGTQKKELSKRAQGKSIVHLHNSDLKKVNLTFPKLEEQKKIGKLVTQLDDIIELLQQKIDNMYSLKSTLLNKMFT